MSNLKSLGIGLVGLTVCLIYACQPKPAEDAAAPMMSTFEPVNATTCRDGEFQLDPACAQQDMTNWANARTSMLTKLPANEQPYLVLGFHIPRYELDSMLTELGDGVDVWAALAIKYDSIQKKNVTTVIFAAKPEATAAAGQEWSYYDFSQPCPDLCNGSPFQN